MLDCIQNSSEHRPFSFAFKKIYGIKKENGSDGIHYTAYLYELNRSKNTYIYGFAVKHWKTLEIALMRYAIRGIACFPIEGIRPDTITENEILKLIDRGFDEMLKQDPNRINI